MERVKEYENSTKRKLLDMSAFMRIPSTINYSDFNFMIPNTEENVVKLCGTTCCFSGWLAVSPEFRELGVTQGVHGGAEFPPFHEGFILVEEDVNCGERSLTGSTLAYLFDLPTYIVERLIFKSATAISNDVDKVIETLKMWLENFSTKTFYGIKYEWDRI